MSRKPH